MSSSDSVLPTKIAYLEQDSRVGGAEVNLLYLLDMLARCDRPEFHPVVLCPRVGPLTDRLTMRNHPWDIVPLPELGSVSIKIGVRKVVNPYASFKDMLRLPAAARAVGHYLKEHRTQLVHTNGIFAHLYGAIAADEANAKCVWHIQDIISPRRAFGMFRRILRNYARRFSPTIIAISSPVAEMFDGLGCEVVLIPNGVDLSEYDIPGSRQRIRAEFGADDLSQVVAVVGRVTAWKGQREFVQAAKGVLAENPNAVFWVVGDAGFDDDSYLQGVKKLAEVLGLGDRCVFTGFRDDIAEIMQAIDVLVLPSQDPEPFGRVVIEAMAAGKPVVATRHGGVVEIIEDGETGLLVTPHDTKMLADSVSTLLINPAISSLMGQSARRVVEERFTIEQFTQSICSVYRQALKDS